MEACVRHKRKGKKEARQKSFLLYRAKNCVFLTFQSSFKYFFSSRPSEDNPLEEVTDTDFLGEVTKTEDEMINMTIITSGLTKDLKVFLLKTVPVWH